MNLKDMNILPGDVPKGLPFESFVKNVRLLADQLDTNEKLIIEARRSGCVSFGDYFSYVNLRRDSEKQD